MESFGNAFLQTTDFISIQKDSLQISSKSLGDEKTELTINESGNSLLANEHLNSNVGGLSIKKNYQSQGLFGQNTLHSTTIQKVNRETQDRSFGSNSASQTDSAEIRLIYMSIQKLDLGKVMGVVQNYDLRKSVEIMNLLDETGYTLLHAAAYYNTCKVAEYLISFFTKRLTSYLQSRHVKKYKLNNASELDNKQNDDIVRSVKAVLKEWVNRPSRGEEGFSALHFASFHGNIKLIKMLVTAGANIHAKNKQGINMLHVAAQGDQAYSLTYFKTKGVSLKETDGERSTPLHWACFAGSDTAIYYLLAWGVDVNAQDNVGNTPLHLAVKSAEHFPNTRSIKELLIKGANRITKDNNGRRPVDMAKEIGNDRLKQELQMLLARTKNCCTSSHVKQPLKKLQQSNKTLSIYISIMLVSFIALLLFVFPFIPSHGWIVTLLCLFITVNVFFFLSFRKNPGFLVKSTKVGFLKLVEKFDPNMLCPTCEVICTTESRHCYICNRCVERFDHHCQWINNCVGLRNHSFFYMYITSLAAYMVIIEIMGFQNVENDFALESLSIYDSALIPNLLNLLPENAETCFQATLVIILSICTFFLMPLLFLVVVQTQNFMYNQTTNKRFSKFKRIPVNDQVLAQVANLKDSDHEDNHEDNNLFSLKQQSEIKITKFGSIVTDEHQHRGCTRNKVQTQNDLILKIDDNLSQTMVSKSRLSSRKSSQSKPLFDFEEMLLVKQAEDNEA